MNIVLFLDNMIPVFIMVVFLWIGVFVEPPFGRFIGRLASRDADGYGCALLLTCGALFGGGGLALFVAVWIGKMHPLLTWLG